MTTTPFTTIQQGRRSRPKAPQRGQALDSATGLGDRLRSDRGQVATLFALMVPMLLALAAVVIGIGNWYVHGRHLQTKADSGALAGGQSWEFPCGAETNTRIEDSARTYAGPDATTPGGLNPQVGGVTGSNVHSVLNGTDFYDDDTNPAPIQRNLFPPDTTICPSMKLDVKLTEDNSFPLASVLPLFPDIKRRARVEIQQVAGVFGLLPIAVRAPEPVSAAAVFYDEDPSATPSKRILGVKYFVKAPGITGMPGGLQGWSTYNTEDGAGGTSSWANFTPSATTGVAIAISFRGACDTNLPNPNTKIMTSPAPCFEDNFVGQSITNLCNQGVNTQIVNCYDDTGNWPTENTVSGLQFIRGYPTGSVSGAGPPQLRKAYLDNGSCSSSTYFNAHPNSACSAILTAVLDIGDDVLPPPPPGGTQTRVPANVEVRYRIANDTGNYSNNVCNSFGTPQCELTSSSGGPGNTTWSTTNRVPLFNANSGRNAIALRVRYKSPARVGATSCSASGNNCEFFITGNGTSGIGGTNPNDAQILASPVQRMFRGNSLLSSSVQWLRLSTDDGCNTGAPDLSYGEAATVPNGGTSCFFMDIGLKGGLAADAGEQPVLFNDGVGSSQMGSVDCDPNISQGSELTIGVVNGCNVWYQKHPFDWDPLCPSANNLFSGYPTGNPGSPWNDGRWPPIRCIKTRPTGSMNQLEKGLKERLFGNPNANSCPVMPADATGFVKGRNYWDKDNNALALGGQTYGFQEGAHVTHFNENDPRIVTIFIAPTEAFAGNGQNTYPIAGFVEVYVTGFGRINGGGVQSNDDPCPGNDPPADLDLSGGSSSGYAMWGHFLKYRVPEPGATPSGVICDVAALDPCVATLVE